MRRIHARFWLALCLGSMVFAVLPIAALAQCPPLGCINLEEEFEATLERVYQGRSGGGDMAGFAVAGLSAQGGTFDFNGDGFMDYVVASPYYSEPTLTGEICHAGKITIYLGTCPGWLWNGLDDNVSTFDANDPNDPFDIRVPDPSCLASDPNTLVFPGPGFLPTAIEIKNPKLFGANPESAAGDLFGFSVSGAFETDRTPDPDNNEVGYADLIVGAPGSEIMVGGNTLEGAGQAWIIPGRPDLVLPTVEDPNDVAFPWILLVADGAVHPTLGALVSQTDAHFGHSVSYIARDGADNPDSPLEYDDVLVGAPFWDLPGGQGTLVNAGLVFAFGENFAPAGVTNGQAIEAPVQAGIPGVDGPQAGALFGYSVSGAGFFDIAGPSAPYPDIIVGEPLRDVPDDPNPPLVDTGQAYIFNRVVDPIAVPGLPVYARHKTLVPSDRHEEQAFGFSVADIGEFDLFGTGTGMAADDVVVGAPGTRMTVDSRAC